MAETKRRARGEDSVYYDRSRDRWTGTITVGWKPDGCRDRVTVRGRTKTEVKDKLRARHTELAAGVRTTASFTVEHCLKDWLATGKCRGSSSSRHTAPGRDRYGSGLRGRPADLEQWEPATP